MSKQPQKRPLFSLGQIVATPGAIAALVEASQTPDELLSRHVSGDWGDLVAEDISENEYGLQHGLRIFSSYRLSTGVKLWIITEHDVRRVTA